MIKSMVDKMRGDIPYAEIARKVGTSRQNFHKKVTSESLKAVELIDIAQVLGYEIHVTDKSGNVIA